MVYLSMIYLLWRFIWQSEYNIFTNLHMLDQNVTIMIYNFIMN